MAEDTRPAVGGKLTSPGPYLAKIVSHLDPTYMGGLQVQLMQEVGNDDSKEGQLHQVQYISPFLGQTSVDFVGKEVDDYDNTQKSYGMWMVPPDIGNIVVVIFIDGDPKKGFWFGCIQDRGMNFSMPGYAATSYHVDGTEERVPVAEYNKKAQAASIDPSQINKPATPMQEVFTEQGLIRDDIRGITTSSARREIPSSVFGISTPGPVDKQSGAKQGAIGKAEYKIPNAFVSRLGGSSFVMDDGDDKFLRKTSASEGPPDYAAVEQGETDGDRTIPHNEVIRFRTRTGHQILMHNSEDLIYIGNARGTTWIELTSDGKIDIYAEDSVSVHTKQDMNFYADRDINFEAGRNFNLKVKEKHQTEVGTDKITIVDGKVAIKVVGTKDEEIAGATKITVLSTLDINASDNTKITTGSALDIKSGGASKLESGGDTTIKAANTAIDGGNINFNSGIAGSADSAEAATPPLPLKTHSLPDEEGSELTQSIMRRIPTHEPWPHHENLDPQTFKPENTDRDVDGVNEGNSTSIVETPEYWKEFSTKTDTFAKIG
jgi:uncharacterized protein (DUF2345 family)